MTDAETQRQDYLSIREKVKRLDKGVVFHRDGYYHVGTFHGYGMISLGKSKVSYAEAWQNYLDSLNQKGV